MRHLRVYTKMEEAISSLRQIILDGYTDREEIHQLEIMIYQLKNLMKSRNEKYTLNQDQ